MATLHVSRFDGDPLVISLPSVCSGVTGEPELRRLRQAIAREISEKDKVQVDAWRIQIFVEKTARNSRRFGSSSLQNVGGGKSNKPPPQQTGVLPPPSRNPTNDMYDRRRACARREF